VTLISTAVLSDIMATVATFLPMKAALVAVGGGGRDFFPGVLGPLGPAWSSLGLASLAILAGVLARFFTSLGQRITVAQTVQHSRNPDGIRQFLGKENQALADGRIESIILSGVFVSVGLVVYLLQLLLVVLATLSLLIYFFRKPQRQSDGGADWSAFGSALRASSTWIAVGAAILGVLSNVTTVTVTQLLLGIVFTRKAMMVFPSVIASSEVPVRGRRASGLGPKARTSRRLVEKNTLLALFTEGGRQPEFARILELKQPESIQMLQLQEPETMAFWSKDSQSEKLSIARVFPPNHRVLAERERLIIESVTGNREIAEVSERLNNAKAYVSFAVHANAVSKNHRRNISAEQAFSWQLQLEKWWKESVHTDLDGTELEKGFLRSLRNKIKAFAELPGSQEQPLMSLLGEWNLVTDVWKSGAPTLGFFGGVSPKRLFPVSQSSLLLIDAGGWRVAPHGADWPAKINLARWNPSLLADAGLGNQSLSEAMMRRNLRSLSSAIDVWDFGAVARLAKLLVTTKL